MAAATEQVAAGSALQALSLQAVVVEGAKPLRDVSFTVQPLENSSRGDVVAKSGGEPAVVQLPSGRYRITARYGDTVRYEDIELGTSPVSRVINLRAGRVHMRLLNRPGGAALQSVNWEILTYGRDATGKRHLVTKSSQPQPEFMLPEGYYVAQAIMTDGSSLRHTIEVTSGHTYKYHVIKQ